jgi:hypothetical protein
MRIDELRFTSSRSEIVFYNRVDSSHAILPVDLLALRVSPAAVGDAHLIDSTTCTGKLGRYLGLNAEPVFLYLNRFD